MDALGLEKALLANVDVGVFCVGVVLDGAGLGELADFFWKKPKMDFWFFADCEADAGCVFCEGRGVDISFPSRPRTITAMLKRNLWREESTMMRDALQGKSNCQLPNTVGKERVGLTR